MDNPTIEIFRTGRHVAESGFVRDYTLEDLANLSTSYDPTLHEAPIVIGHPVNNAPAWGWVKGLRLDGDRLHADLSQVDPRFAAWLNSKLCRMEKYALVTYIGTTKVWIIVCFLIIYRRWHCGC